MVSVPYLALLVETVFGPLFRTVGADPAIAATTFIAVDMGGYQLADVLATTHESWIMAMIMGYMAGVTIVSASLLAWLCWRKKIIKIWRLG